MTDKERLEIIKDKQIQMHALSAFDINFLIEQAERVQALEKQVENERKHKLTYRKVAQRYQGEKNRYRDALVFYADEDNYIITGEKTYIGHGDFLEETWIEVDRDNGSKARKALEDSK